MRTFLCVCGNTLHFENSVCLSCSRPVAFVPEAGVVSPLEPDGEGMRALTAPEHAARVRACGNHLDYDVCNWAVQAGDEQRLCRSCRLNSVIPNLDRGDNLRLWYRIEVAKRRLLYTLLLLGLPVPDRVEDPERGLAFEFLADRRIDPEFADPLGGEDLVFTGHSEGTITINLLEADDGLRESMREEMNELYRTLLGHFRHEIGHYYWRLLIDGERLAAFRARFGDERSGYEEAMAAYYHSGPCARWEQDFVSAYAAAHPWEDWAETWAHYLHMVDTLDTADDFDFVLGGQAIVSPLVAGADAQRDGDGRLGFDDLVGQWYRLTIAMNGLNRSMGLPDAYPFALPPPVIAKLRFVHELIADQRSHSKRGRLAKPDRRL